MSTVRPARAPRRRLPACRIVAVLLIASVASAATPQCPASGERDPYDPPGFLGYACRDTGCTGHKSGFAWADRHGIADMSTCPGDAEPAFAEGCRAYAAEAVTAEQAGFEWARENELTDPCRCKGAGPRFQAGCEAYIAGFAQ